MIHVKIDIEEIAMAWHVLQIVVNKDGERSFVVHADQPFTSKSQAEQDARDRARRYLLDHFGIGDGDIVWEIVPS